MFGESLELRLHNDRPVHLVPDQASRSLAPFLQHAAGLTSLHLDVITLPQAMESSVISLSRLRSLCLICRSGATCTLFPPSFILQLTELRLVNITTSSPILCFLWKHRANFSVLQLSCTFTSEACEAALADLRTRHARVVSEILQTELRALTDLKNFQDELARLKRRGDLNEVQYSLFASLLPQSVMQAEAFYTDLKNASAPGQVEATVLRHQHTHFTSQYRLCSLRPAWLLAYEACRLGFNMIYLNAPVGRFCKWPLLLRVRLQDL